MGVLSRRRCAISAGGSVLAALATAALHDTGSAWVAPRQMRSVARPQRVRLLGRAAPGVEPSPLLLASATGICTGTLVVLLNDFVHLLQDESPEALAPVAPVLAGVLVSLLRFLKPQAFGPEAESSLGTLQARGGRRPRDAAEAPLRALAAGLTLAGGNSLGPESPSVEIGANVAATVARQSKPLRSNLLAAGCASGIAAGFNAPIAGLFFALEAVRPMQDTQGPPMQLLAAVLAATVSQLGLGSSPAVDLDFFDWAPARSLWELPLFMLLGLCCGLVSAALRNLRNLGKWLFQKAEQAGCPSYLFPILGGLVVALVTFSPSTKEVLYRGFANVNLVLQYADGSRQPLEFGDPLLHLLLLLFCKVILTAVCQSSGLVGGLFAPALFMGACLGGVAGRTLRDNFWPWAISLPGLGIVKAFSVPATYAVVAMAACLGSICKVPLTSVVLLLELSGGKDYGVVLPVVAATGVAVYVDDLLSRKPKEAPGASVLVALEASGKASVVVPPSLELSTAREKLLELGEGSLAVVKDETPGQVLGVVSLEDLDRAMERGERRSFRGRSLKARLVVFKHMSMHGILMML